MDDRTAPDGKTALHVQEAQSDWHQEGRKHGYSPSDGEYRQALEDHEEASRLAREAAQGAEQAKRQARALRTPNVAEVTLTHPTTGESVRRVTSGGQEEAEFRYEMARKWGVRPKETGYEDVPQPDNGFEAANARYREASRASGEAQTRLHETRARLEALSEARMNSIPAGPFSKTWHMLALKRALWEAAHGGYDRLTWNTGDHQAQIYPGLSPEQKEGMKGFYDQKLPNDVNAYVKKWGGRVGRSEISAAAAEPFSEVYDPQSGHVYSRWGAEPSDPRIAQDLHDALEMYPGSALRGSAKTTTVHSVDITPEMRQSVLSGQPLAQRGPEAAAPATGPKPDDRAKAEASGAIMPIDPVLQRAANQYNKAHGLPPMPERPAYVKPDARAGDIADAFDAMRHAPGDPAVRASYDALKRGIRSQWDWATKKQGITFEPWTREGQPYADSKEMAEDVRGRRHLFFFRGGDMPADHPLSQVADPETGLNYNDYLRAIHDLYGHATEGYGFGARGEENAWVKHSKMFPPEAIPALTTETKGQNSWVNSGAHLRDASGKLIEKGRPGFVPADQRPFAEQKAGLLPAEYHRRLEAEDGRDRQASPGQRPGGPGEAGVGRLEGGGPRRGPGADAGGHRGGADGLEQAPGGQALAQRGDAESAPGWGQRREILARMEELLKESAYRTDGRGNDGFFLMPDGKLRQVVSMDHGRSARFLFKQYGVPLPEVNDWQGRDGHEDSDAAVNHLMELTGAIRVRQFNGRPGVKFATRPTPAQLRTIMGIADDADPRGGYYASAYEASPSLGRTSAGRGFDWLLDHATDAPVHPDHGASALAQRGDGGYSQGARGYYFDRSGDPHRFDSSYEAARMHELDNDPNVAAWYKNDRRSGRTLVQIRYRDSQGKGRTYIPDLIWTDRNGEAHTEEVKASDNEYAPDVALKSRAARNAGGSYRVVTENDIDPEAVRSLDDKAHGRFTDAQGAPLRPGRVGYALADSPASYRQGIQLLRQRVARFSNRVSYEAVPGDGADLGAQYPPLSSLPYAKRAAITRHVGETVVPEIMRAAGVRNWSHEFGPGGYETDQNPSGQIAMRANPEQRDFVMNLLGHALKQTEIWASRYSKGGKHSAIDITQTDGADLADPARVQAFFDDLRAKAPDVVGYQPLTTGGGPGLRLINGGGKWSKADVSRIVKAADETAKAHGLTADASSGTMALHTVENNWRDNPDGRGYVQRLVGRSPGGVRGEDALDNVGAAARRGWAEAYALHAGDELRQWRQSGPAGSGGRGGVPGLPDDAGRPGRPGTGGAAQAGPLVSPALAQRDESVLRVSPGVYSREGLTYDMRPSPRLSAYPGMEEFSVSGADGKPVAWVSVERRGSTDASSVHISRIDVDPAYRRRGVATTLLRLLPDALRRQGWAFRSVTSDVVSDEALRLVNRAYGQPLSVREPRTDTSDDYSNPQDYALYSVRHKAPAPLPEEDPLGAKTPSGGLGQRGDELSASEMQNAALWGGLHLHGGADDFHQWAADLTAHFPRAAGQIDALWPAAHAVAGYVSAHGALPARVAFGDGGPVAVAPTVARAGRSAVAPGVQSWDQTRAKAADAGVTPALLRSLAPGEVPRGTDPAAFSLAVRTLHAETRQRVALAAEAYRSAPTASAKTYLAAAARDLATVTAHRDKLATSAGRTLNQQNIALDPFLTGSLSPDDLFRPDGSSPSPRSASYGAGNRVFTRPEALEARRSLTGVAGGQFAQRQAPVAQRQAPGWPSPADPLVALGGFHREAGLRTFPQWAAQMARDVPGVKVADLRRAWKATGPEAARRMKMAADPRTFLTDQLAGLLDPGRAAAAATDIAAVPNGRNGSVDTKALAEALARHTPTDLGDRLGGMLRSALLSGPQTLGKIGLAHVLVLLTEELSRPATALAAKALGVGDRAGGLDLAASGRAVRAALTRGVREGGHILTRGEPSLTLEGLNRFADPGRGVHPEWASGLPGPLGAALNGAVRAPMRVHGALYHALMTGIYERGLLEQSRLAAQAEAQARGLSGAQASAYVSRRAASLAASPTADVAERARAYTREMIFQNDNALNSGIEAVTGRNPVTKLAGAAVVPFTKVPSNIAGRTLEYTPVGTAYALANALADLIARRPVTPEARLSLAKAFGRGVTGTALAAIGYQWAKSGGLVAPDEKEHEYGSVRALGRKFEVGQYGPPASALLAGATAQSLAARAQSPVPWDRPQAADVVSAAAGLAKDSPLIRASSTLDALGNGQTKDLRGAADGLAGMAVPALLSQTAALTDPARAVRQKATMRDYLANRVPGLRERLPVQHTTGGSPVPQPDFFSSVPDAKPSDLDAFLAQLHREKTALTAMQPTTPQEEMQRRALMRLVAEKERLMRPIFAAHLQQRLAGQ